MSRFLKSLVATADSDGMAVDSALAAPRTIAASRIRIGARASLAGIVYVSFVVRELTAIAHPTPTYFPDEYVYAAVSRSLGDTGRPLVRGAGAHFPALLEPLLAAPFHALCSPAAAYRLTQLENALFMSLAAVPVYLIARRLTLSARYALACAVFAVAIPDLV